jgi:type IV pilus assembly protein PilW
MLNPRSSGFALAPTRFSLGMSLVELMVGLALGMFVVAGASVLMTNQLADNRRLMLETQMHQDLRAAADLIARDLKRAYWWYAPETSVWRAGFATQISNPYAANSPASSVAPTDNMTYWISSGSASVAEDNAVDVSDQYGFQLSNYAIEMKRGAGSWQAMTDVNTMKIIAFRLTVNASVVPIACFACTAGSATCPPQQVVRQVSVLITGQAVHDPSVIRSISNSVRLRNDLIEGTCP